MKSIPNPTIKAMSQVMTFGKYKGQTVKWLMDLHPSYLLWLRDNSVCNVTHSIYAKANSAYKKQLSHRFIIRTGRYSYESIYPDDNVWSYFDPH